MAQPQSRDAPVLLRRAAAGQDGKFVCFIACRHCFVATPDEMRARRSSAGSDPGRVFLAPFAEVRTAVDRFSQLSRKAAVQNLAGKGEKCTSSVDFVFLSSEGFCIASGRQANSRGWNAGSRRVTRIRKDHLYPTHSLVGECEGR
jgi:hypothetical protein